MGYVPLFLYTLLGEFSIYLYLCCSSLTLVAQSVHITAIGSVTYDYTHAAVYLCIGFTENADISIRLHYSLLHSAVAGLLF